MTTSPKVPPTKGPGGKRKGIRQVRKRVIAKVRDVETRASQSDSKRVRASLYVWRLCAQVLRQWQQDRCPQQAASLSFQLLLSIVPVLAVIFAAFRVTGAMGAESIVISFLTTELIPLSAEEVSTKLLSWSANINVESMGIIGIVATMLIAFVIFNSMDQCISLIWRVENRRSLPKRLATFYATFTIGPLVFGLSLYPAAQFGLTDGWSGATLSALTSFSGLFLANYLLPATPVKARAAMAGAALNTVAFELAKLAFASYVGGYAMERYAGIYGAVAIVPLSLVWIYWSWLMFLLGVEVTHIVQNYHLLESRRRNPISLQHEFETRINASMGLKLSVALASAQAAGRSGASRFRLGTDLLLSDDGVRHLLHRLENEGLVNENADDDKWSLSRPASDISVQDVFDAFYLPGQTHRPDELGSGEMETVLSRLLRAARKPLEACSLDDMLIEIAAAKLESDALTDDPVVGGLADGVDSKTNQE